MDRIDGYRLGEQLAALEREEEWEPFLRARLLRLRREAAQKQHYPVDRRRARTVAGSR